MAQVRSSSRSLSRLPLSSLPEASVAAALGGMMLMVVDLRTGGKPDVARGCLRSNGLGGKWQEKIVVGHFLRRELTEVQMVLDY